MSAPAIAAAGLERASLTATGQLRVAFVSPFGLRPKGTTSARVLPIARVLASQGVSVRVIIPPWDDPRRAGQRWHEAGVEVVHTGVARSPGGSVGLVWQLLSEVRRFDPDVVHCFKPIGFSGLLAALLTASARRRGGPLVVLDADDLEGPGGWSRRRGLGLAGAIRGVQETATLRQAPLVSVASGWLRDYVLELGRDPQTILSLPNGHTVAADEPLMANRTVDSEGAPTTSAHPIEVETPAPTLLWYTRFTEVQPQRVVAILTRVVAQLPDVRLVVVGEEIGAGDRAKVAAALADAGLADRVEWRGYDPRNAEGWLREDREHAVAIYPLDDDATNRARCPAKIPQLMALGVPIVAEAVGEIPTYLAGFENPCLVAPGNHEMFAARVIALLQDHASHSEVGDRLQYAARRWRCETVAAPLLPWYKDHLNRAQVPSRQRTPSVGRTDFAPLLR